MKILKGTNHAKIAGDFGEAIVLYWLSKHGFEAARINHTGIDLIATRRGTTERMGISVKARTRMRVTRKSDVLIPLDHFEKIENSCREFGLKPYLSLVIEEGDFIRVYIMPLSCAKKHGVTKKAYRWYMSEELRMKYAKESAIMRFDLKIDQGNWWTEVPTLN
jgi:Holliday junction resolvase-like predicted endonuclease